MRYWPDSSETPVRTLVMSAGLDASIVTPGRTAPDVSRTVPARLCALATLAPALRMATTTSNRINIRFMSEPPQPFDHEEFGVRRRCGTMDRSTRSVKKAYVSRQFFKRDRC